MKVGQFFETRKRDDNNEPFVTLKDDAPEWLQGAVRDAHRDTMPNDWIFWTCEAACNAWDEGSLTEDGIHEFADSGVDVYTKKLFQWAADFCLTDTYSEAEAEAKDLGVEDPDVSKAFTIIQYCAIRYIAEVMRNACEKNASVDS